MAKLNAAKRSALPKSEFGMPGGAVGVGVEVKLFKRRWPCILLGHFIEIIWSNDSRGEFVALCRRCGEAHSGRAYEL